MTRSESLELVLFGWVDTLRRRDPDRIEHRLADDIVWQGLRTDLVCRDRGAVLDNIRSGGQHRDRISGLEIDVVDDERVPLAFRMPGVTELYGEPVAGEIHSVFTLRGGVIVRIDEFRTKDEAINSASVSIAPRDAARVQPTSVRSPLAQQVVPILNVSDIRESFAWFEKLGWRKGFEWPAADSLTGPGFGSVESGRCEIFLCRDGQGSRGRGPNTQTFGPEGDETADKGTWMSIWVDDLEALYERCVTEQLDITHPPTDEPWGVREFHVRHPDGHVLRISKTG